MKHRGNPGQALFRGLALLTAYVAAAHAGSFTVNPVRLTLSATQSVAAVTVKNVGEEATVVQLETSSWTQHDGQDVLTSTTDILATPPIITVPPGASRIVRVGLRRPADPQRELTYRMFLREVPPPQPLAQGLRVALLISIPVFVTPPHLPGPQVQWRAIRLHDGNIQLQARNTGQAHIQLGQLQIVQAANGTEVVTRNMADYLLPDNGHEWTLTAGSAPPAGTLLSVTSIADIGPLKASVKLEDESRESDPKTPGTAAR
ncbi:MAG TPA: molecular chaperone [Steroidobacteraceae bacterium]